MGNQRYNNCAEDALRWRDNFQGDDQADANGPPGPNSNEELSAQASGFSIWYAMIEEPEGKLRRYVILILLALAITACSGPQKRTPDRVDTQVVGEEATLATITLKAPTATPKSTDTGTPAPTSTPARTATQSATPSPSSTPTPTQGSTQPGDQMPPTPTPGSTSTNTDATKMRIQDGMTMVYVPAGDFTMGSPAGFGSDEEVPPHKVTLDSFWIDRTEVTNAQYRAFVEETGHRAPTSCDWGDPTYDDGAKANHPVVCVSWDDAKAYCEWDGAHLPTEAEWEKAARGTDGRAYPWGNNFDGSRFNYCDTNCEFSQKDTGADDGYAQTAPVGSYLLGASPYGALDMAGNVWEWVSDWYSFGYYNNSPKLNPQGPDSGHYRGLRGGAWNGFATNERSAFRGWLLPDKRDIVIGFRCVVSDTHSP